MNPKACVKQKKCQVRKSNTNDHLAHDPVLKRQNDGDGRQINCQGLGVVLAAKGSKETDEWP